jgi:hypothetical protein
METDKTSTTHVEEQQAELRHPYDPFIIHSSQHVRKEKELFWRKKKRENFKKKKQKERLGKMKR